MAKRFRDTKKWRGWYRELPPVIKLLFDYMCDDCSHAGVVKEDYVIASICIGETVTREDVEKHLRKHVIRIDDDKLFIPSFIEFQYDVGVSRDDGKLNPANNAHKGVIKELISNGIDPGPWLLAGLSSAPVSIIPKTSPSVAPSEGLGRGPGKGIRNGNGIGNGRGGVGEKPNQPVPIEDTPSADVCRFCSASGEVFVRGLTDDREASFRCSCPKGDALERPPDRWSPLMMAQFEVLTFNGRKA